MSPFRPLAAFGALAPARVRFVAAGCAAKLAGTGLLLAGEGMPPLLRVGTAAFLSLVVFEDVRRMRIPNALTFTALPLALGAAAICGGGPGLLSATLGAFAALVILLAPYALGWLGAGDVKAMMVVGALFGAHALPPLLFSIILAGGTLALAYLAARGELGDLLHRWWLSLQTTLILRRPHYFGPQSGSAAASGLPFGVAMACGAIAFSLFGGAR